jgi:hypothetical protein
LLSSPKRVGIRPQFITKVISSLLWTCSPLIDFNVSFAERVWKAEQEKEQEKKKTELLRKQMMEEREMDEIRKLQGKDTSKEKLAWMYAPVGIQNDADEYLMGKPKETVHIFSL